MGAFLYDYKKNTTESEKEWRGDLDFEHSFSEKSKLEGGFQLRMDRTNEDYRYYDHDSVSGDWVEDLTQSNKYDFSHDIYALYGTYSTEIKKLGIKAGLRAEYTNRNLHQITGNDDYPFPSSGPGSMDRQRLYRAWPQPGPDAFIDSQGQSNLELG